MPIPSTRPAARWSTVPAAALLLGAASPRRLPPAAPPIHSPGFHISALLPLAPGAVSGDYVIAPPYVPAPEETPQPGVPKGAVYHLVMDSHESRIYPGISKSAPGQLVPYQRHLTVYVPAGYAPETPAPLLVSQDSLGADILPTILDTLIAERRVPPLIAVMIDSGGGDAQGSERGLEYDTVSGRYAEFVQTEVLPLVARALHVAFTRDPNGRMTMGGSSGGAAAFTMAWFRPDLFRRVISYSGTFVNQQSPVDPKSPEGAWDYHQRFIARSRRKPLRVWLEVGERDIGYDRDAATLHNWVMANERMAQELRAKRYRYMFVFARDAGHVDGPVFRQTLPQALEWAWRGYR